MMFTVDKQMDMHSPHYNYTRLQRLLNLIITLHWLLGKAQWWPFLVPAVRLNVLFKRCWCEYNILGTFLGSLCVQICGATNCTTHNHSKDDI